MENPAPGAVPSKASIHGLNALSNADHVNALGSSPEFGSYPMVT